MVARLQSQYSENQSQADFSELKASLVYIEFQGSQGYIDTCHKNKKIY